MRLGILQSWIGAGVVCAGIASSAAQAEDFRFTLTPIVGFEHVKRTDPVPYGKWRFLYGVGVVGGYRILSGEAEATRASDTEVFPTQDITDRTEEDRLKLGVRTEYSLSSVFSSYFRLGGQASRGKRDRTTAGVTTTQTIPLQLRPYLGSGLRVDLATSLQLQAGVTVVFRDFPRMGSNEYQTDFGLNVRLGDFSR